jgi:hypothetical protein
MVQAARMVQAGRMVQAARMVQAVRMVQAIVQTIDGNSDKEKSSYSEKSFELQITEVV